MYTSTSSIAANAPMRERSLTGWGRITAALSLILLMMLSITGANAQVASSYSATKSYGTYTPITTGGGASTAFSGSFYYYTGITNVTLPTAITYNGTTYNNICIYPGGYLNFTNSSCNTYTQNPLTSGTYNGVISPAANYLYYSSSATGGTAAPAVLYQQVGQEFVVQWQDMSSYGTTGAKYGFQARINTCNGVIKFVYDSVMSQNTAATYPYAYVGIRGSSSSDYISWNNASGNWNGATTSTSSASGCYLYTTSIFNKGFTFTFTPTSGGAMALTSSPSFSTASVQSVSPGNTNAVITRVDFPVGGVTGSLILDSFIVRSNCTNDADVSGIKLFYTTTPSFSTASQLGSTVSGFTGGYASFTGLNKSLDCGGNYVWVCYNISNSATVGNVVDAKWDANSVKVGSNTYPASAVSPSGSRTIANPVTFSAANAYQATTAVVFKNTTDQVVLQLKVDMSASGGPADLTQLVLNTVGSGTATNNATTNIQNAKIYYTGSSSTFATSTQFGSTIAAPNGTITFNGSQAIGTNSSYFWLTYDVKTAANSNDSIDAKWTGATIDGSTQTITQQNPTGVRKIIPNYCGYTWANGTNSGTMGITNVTLSTLNNSTSVGASAAMNNFTNLAANITKKGNYNVSVTTGSFGSLQSTAVFVDWNQDGDYADAGERLGTTLNGAGNFNTRTYNFTVPCSAVTGPTRMRVVLAYNQTQANLDNPCNTVGSYGEGEEYTINIADSSLVYATSYSTQTITTAVLGGSNNNQIIGVPVLIGGCGGGGLSLTQLQLNTNGSTNTSNDIDSARVFYTGNSNVFATTTRFGAAGSLSTSTFNVNGTQSLVADTNWFWVAYNLKGGASVGNVVDAECSQITVSSNNYTPTITAPSGSRTIDNLMTFTSADAFQSNTANVYRSDIRNELLGVNVVMSTGVSLNMTQMKFNLSGSTNISNDIDTVRIYFTGSSNVFSTAVQFGTGSLTGATLLTNPFTVNGTIALAPGNNYFWLAAGVKAAATVNNVIDAQCTQITIGSPVGVQTPSTTNPSGNRVIKAAYCAPTSGSFTGGAGIVNVSVGSINNSTTTPPAAGTSTFTNYCAFYNPAFTTTQRRAASLTLSATTGTYTGTAQFIGAWADWDQSGTFDAGEFLGINGTGVGGNTTVSLPFTVPCTAALGNTRIRVKHSYSGTFTSTTSCTAVVIGEIEDYMIVVQDSALTWQSVSCVQNTTSAVATNTNNNNILQVQVVMTGCTGTKNVDKFTLSTSGSTDPGNDVGNIKVFYTGNVATFATTTQYGGVGSQNGSFDLYPSGTINLVKDTNNFWVTYDITSTGTNGNVVDAQCTDVPVSGTSYTPTITSPSGNRQIQAPQTYTSHTWSKFTNSSTQGAVRQVTTQVQLTMSSGTGINLDSLIFNTTGSTNPATTFNNARIYFTGNSGTFATTTQIYAQTISSPNGTFGFGGTMQLVPGVNNIWLTYDVLGGATVGNVFTGNLVRVRIAGTSYNATPTSVTGTKTVIAPYCIPTSTNMCCGFGIKKVVLGSINNSNSSLPANNTQSEVYKDLTATFSTDLKKQTSQTMTVQPGTYGSTQNIAAWIDWNGDGDFYDAGEKLGEVNNMSSNVDYTINFSVPCTAVLGTTRMRVFHAYNTANLDPCTTNSYNEVEDYTVNILDSAATYASSNTITASTAQVAQGATNAHVIALTVTTLGCGGTLPLTAINLSTNGSDNASGDITSAKVFYTGNSNVFSTATQFGSTVSSPSGNFTVNGSQNLTGGVNYFWLAYDVSGSATVNNNVDGECNSFVVSGNTQTPSNTAPSGSRNIQSPMTFNSVTWDQNSSNVSTATQNAQMTRIVVNMTSGAPINMDSVVASTQFTGTGPITTDVANAKCFFTGTSATFATTTQFGSTITSPNGTMKFIGAQALAAGNNYFWITYNIGASPNLNDSVAAPLSKLTINGTNITTGSASPAGKRKIIGAYCIPTSLGVCCSFGIVDVKLGSIQNTGTAVPTSTAASETHKDYTNMNTNIKRLSNQTVTVQGNGGGNPQNYEVFIDWNQDGDFADAGEDVGGQTGVSQFVDAYISFQVPCSATLGTTRMRVMSVYNSYSIVGAPCTSQYYIEAEDYSVTIQDSAYAYVSSTTTQTVTSAVQQSSTNQQIIGLQITGGGCGSNPSLTTINLSTNGSTSASDITSAKVFYTGTNSTFATTTQFGSTVSNPSGSFSVTGSQALPGGTNYLWITYNISGSATLGNVVDAECSDFVLGGVTRTPTVTAPSGSRPIQNPMTFNNVSWTKMQNNVTKGTANADVIQVVVNMNAGASVNMDSLVASTVYSGSGSIGGSINSARCYFTGTSSSFGTTTQYGSQITSPNGNMNFSGTAALAVGNNYFWISYSVSATATTNDSFSATLSSVRVDGTSQTAGSATNTRMRKIIPDYCTFTSQYGTNGGTMGITKVVLGSINNTTTINNSVGTIVNYTNLSTDLSQNVAASLSVTAGSYTYACNVVAYIDWNQDGDFDDSGELVGATSLNTSGPGPFTFTFTTPCSAVTGQTRLRVFHSYSLTGTPNGCHTNQTFTYGEGEDYTVNVIYNPRQVVAMDVTTALNASVATGANNAEMLKMMTRVSGCGSLNLTNLNFSTNGNIGTNNASTNLSNADVFYTGASATFATTTTFGSASSPSGSFSVTGSQSLSLDTSYFWLAYDVSGSANLYDTLDASISGGTAGASFSATNGNPSGYRVIDNPMTYSSSTIAMPNTSVVIKASTTNSIVRLKVTMSNTGYPIALDSMILSTTGTNNPLTNLQNAKLYYTGASTTFATTTLFGSNIAAPNGTMAFGGTNINLMNGDNYFWLSSGIKSGANTGDSVTATFDRVVIAGTDYTPGTTSVNTKRKIIPKYCAPSFVDYNYAAPVQNITIGSLSVTPSIAYTNGGSCSSSIPYLDYSNTQASIPDVQRYSNPTITLKTGTYTGTLDVVALWVDLNQDGAFAANEMVKGYTTGLGANQTKNMSFSVPCSAALGHTRARFLIDYYNYFTITNSCPTGCIYYGSAYDFTINITDSNLSYVTSYAAHPSTTAIAQNTNNNAILAIPVITGGCGGTLTADAFTVNTSGSTNASSDLTNARMFYTGNSNIFGTATQFGSTQSSPSGSFTVSGSQNLTTDTNWFWLAYDVASGATVGNVADAQCTGLSINSNSQTPTTTNPSGNRPIQAQMTLNTLSWLQITNSLVKGTNNNAITRINVKMNNGGSVNLDAIEFSTTGTTNPSVDLSNAKVYYTGASTTFSTGTQYGSTVTSPSGTITVNGTMGLASGDNYFWIAYSIPSGATSYDSVTAPLAKVTINGTDHTAGAATTAGKARIIPPYCTFSWIYTYTTGFGITNVNLGSINNTTAATGGIGSIQDFTNMTTDIQKKSTNSMTIKTGSYDYNQNHSVWIDWNQDGVFQSTEKVYDTYSSGTGSVRTYTFNVTPPCSAALGNTRMRVIMEYSSSTTPSGVACGGLYYNYYGEGEDYTVNVTDVALTYASSYVAQASTLAVPTGSSNNQIIAIPVITDGCGGTLTATSFSLNTTGSTSPSTDISTAKLWYTGNGNTFQAVTQFGSQSSPSGSFTITGTQNLTYDTNWFWLAYDVPSGATNNNYLDAQCTGFTVGTNRTPSVTNPGGNRQIQAPMTFNSVSWTQITSAIVKGTSDNAMTRITVNMNSGASVNLDSIIFATTGSDNVGTNVASAKCYYTGGSSTFATTTVFGTIQNSPNGTIAVAGTQALAVGNNYFWIAYSLNSGANFGDSVTAPLSKITVNGTDQSVGSAATSGKRRIINPYCIPTSSNMCCGFGITLVQLGTINNTTSFAANNSQSEVYKDYTNLSTNLQRLSANTVTFKAGTYGSTQNIAVWIDWNQDGDFYDAGEKLGEQNNMNSSSNYTVNFTVPCSAALGSTRMRLFHAYNTTGIDPCNTNSYNEVEDYTVVITDSTASYNTSTVAQASTASVPTNVTNAQIINVKVMMYGCGGSIPVTQFNLSTSGSSNASGDITNATMYYTGNSTTFATTTTFGSTSSPNGSFSITGSQNMMGDTNNFWLAYDIASGATVGNSVDACCNTFVLNSSTKTPAITCPTGSRLIQNPMTFNSVSWSQMNSNIPVGNATNIMAMVTVNMSTGASVNLDSLVTVASYTGTGGMTTDATNAKVFFTGSSSTFATTTQYGSTIASLSNTTLKFFGLASLNAGNNYFWITYDVPGSANVNDSIATTLSKVTVNTTDQTAGSATTAGKRKLIAAYCLATSYYTYSGMGIQQVVLGSINNSTSSAGPASTASSEINKDFTSMSTNLQKQTSNTLTVKACSYTSTHTIAAWIDWNADGDFTDSGEQLGENVNINGNANTTFNFTVPCGAANGQTRMRVMHDYSSTGLTPCWAGNYVEVEDYTINVLDSPFVYISSTTTQAVTTAVQPSNTNKQIIGVEIVMGGCGGSSPITQFDLNTAGSTDPSTDITNAKVYYTGTSNVFATTTQYGSTVSSPNGSFTVSGSQNPQPGTNYFWITYDIAGGANLGDVVDATCASFVLNSSTKTPSVTNPSGNRLIQNPMTFNSLSWTRNGNNVIQGTNKTDMIMVNVVMNSGASINLDSLVANTSTSQNITTNASAARCYFTGSSTAFGTTTQYGSTINTPSGNLAFNGTAALAVGNNYFWIAYDVYGTGTSNVNDSITATLTSVYTDGATQFAGSPVASARRNIIAPYCTPGWNYGSYNGMGITNVTFGSINNTTTATTATVHDFTNQSTTVLKNVVYSLSMTHGSYSYYVNKVAYIDWNQDGDFADAGEAVAAFSDNSGTLVSQSTHSFNVTVPCSASVGTTRMRVIYGYNTSVSPCSTTLGYGEAEDYTIVVGDNPMQITSATTTQPFTTFVSANSTNNGILRTRITRSGCGSTTFTATQLDYNTNGSTSASDISAAKVFFTGTSSVFATTTQFGSTVSSPSGSFSVTGSQAITGDTNYFWLTYDIASGATVGNVVDADGAVATINSTTYGSSSSYSGNRVIATTASITSMDVAQVTGSVQKGSNRNGILRVNIVGGGTGTPQTATGLDFNISGTNSSDISNVRVYYTGSSSTFATTTQYGSTYANPIYNFTITGSQAINGGNNYFWLAYDVPSSATVGNCEDGIFEQVTLDSAGSTITKTPANGDPSGCRTIINAYCSPSWSSVYTTGFGITNFKIGTIDNTTAANNGQSGTMNYTNLSTNLTRGATYNVQFTTGTYPYYQNFSVWYDWNQDGVFQTSEMGYTWWNGTTYTSTYTGSYNITVPCNAVLGATRVRIIDDYQSTQPAVPSACGLQANYGEAEDYTIVILDSALNVQSMTAAQPNTSDVFASSSNNEIARISVVTAGCSGNVPVTNFNLSTNGSTSASDISAAKVFYTGNSSTYATATQFGSTVSSPSGSFNVSGTQNLTTGTNYFWVAYDVASGATTNNVVDAEVSDATINGNTYNSAVTAPTGSRMINVPMSYTSSTVANSQCGAAVGGSRFAQVARIEVVMGSGAPVNLTQFNLSTSGSVSSNLANDLDTVRVFYTGTSSTFTTTTQFGTFVNPNGTFQVTGTQALQTGTNYFWVTYRMKDAATAGDSVTAMCSQMVIDATNRTPSPTSPACKRRVIPAYCKPTFTNFLSQYFYVSRVKIGSLDNSTGEVGVSPYYADYSSTISAPSIQVGASQTLQVSPGTYPSGVYIAAWIDLNQDGDFADANEKLGEVSNASPMTTLSNITFTLPSSGTVMGQTRMRVMVEYSSANAAPCGSFSYGECEDYAVTLTPPAPPAPTITPSSTTFCVGIGTTFSAGTAQAGYTYTWKEGTTVKSQGTGSPYNQFSYNPAYTGTFNITCTVTDPFSQSGTSNTASVTINPNATSGTASAFSTSLCSGQADTMFLTGFNGTIQWQRKIGAGAWADLSGETNDTMPFTPAVTAQYRAKVSFGSCTPAYSNIVTVSIGATNVWLGATNTQWNVASNWCNGSVPTASSIVTISSTANQPEIAYAAQCSTLTINAGATLTLNNGANLSVNGAYVKNSSGTLTHNGGQLNLAVAQNIPGQAYYYLKLSGAGSYRFTGNASVANYLVIPNATTFLSDSGFTISVAGDINNNGTIQSSGSGKLVTTRTTSYQSVGGNGSFGNLEVNNGSAGIRFTGNSTITKTLTLTSGTVVVNNGQILTVGSTGTSTGTIVTTGGTGIQGASGTTSELRILGNSSAAQITNLKVPVIGVLTINRTQGVKLGGNALVRATLNVNNGTLNMNGFNLNVSSLSSTTSGYVVTNGTGKVKNASTTSGSFAIYGTTGGTQINPLYLDSMYKLIVRYPMGVKLGSSFKLHNLVSIEDGFIDLNSYVVTLSSTASVNEYNHRQFTGATGYLTTTRSFGSAITNSNVAGLGLIMTNNMAMNNTTIIRGHTLSSNNGQNSVARYYQLQPTSTSGLQFSYFEFRYDSLESQGNQQKHKVARNTVAGATSGWVGIASHTRNAGLGYPYNYQYVNTKTFAWVGSTMVFSVFDSTAASLSPVVNSSTAQELTAGNVWPNPFTSAFTLEFTSALAGTADIRMTDMQGRSVYSGRMGVSEGANRFNYEGSSMAAGVYTVTVTNGSSVQTFRVTKAND